MLKNALTWFKDATQNGISNFDYIGISYYPKWSSQNLTELSQSIRQLIDTYGKEVMIVETAYHMILSIRTRQTIF